MTTWRYTATFETDPDHPDTNANSLPHQTRPFGKTTDSGSDAIEGLQSFYESSYESLGTRLLWVTLERSDIGADPNDAEGQWFEVKRLA
jgi:hypothetical protein